MTRRSTLTLTTMALLGLAIAAFPQACFAQSDPFLGTWQLNLAKSKYSPGPPLKSEIVNTQAEGQDLKITFTGIGPDGNPFSVVVTDVLDGMPHPRTGNNPNIDAIALTRVDAYTLILSRTKAGKLVGTGTVAPIPAPIGKSTTLRSMISSRSSAAKNWQLRTETACRAARSFGSRAAD
jgi:hypothetical protein